MGHQMQALRQLRGCLLWVVRAQAEQHLGEQRRSQTRPGYCGSIIAHCSWVFHRTVVLVAIGRLGLLGCIHLFVTRLPNV